MGKPKPRFCTTSSHWKLEKGNSNAIARLMYQQVAQRWFSKSEFIELYYLKLCAPLNVLTAQPQAAYDFLHNRFDPQQMIYFSWEDFLWSSRALSSVLSGACVLLGFQ